jgi:hypothetical protein
MKITYTAIVSALLISSGCARMTNDGLSSNPTGQAASPASPNLAWARIDGQVISSSPELTAQARKDISECRAAAPPVRTGSGVAGEACMNQRGYHVFQIS